jgi:hypothetical protein
MAIGLGDAEDTIPQVSLSALRTGHALLSRNICISDSGIHFCYRLSEPQAGKVIDKIKLLHRVSNTTPFGL